MNNRHHNWEKKFPPINIMADNKIIGIISPGWVCKTCGLHIHQDTRPLPYDGSKTCSQALMETALE